jgi:hypothetical protein
MKEEIKVFLITIISLFITTVYAEENVTEPSDFLGEFSKVLNEFKGYNKNINETIGENGNNNINTEGNITLRDPFNSLNSPGASQVYPNNPGSGFLPRAGHTKIPQILLKGIIVDSEKENNYLALLELKNNGVYMVREGDEISFDQANPGTAIRIKSISRLSVLVEVGDLGNAFIIR